MSLKYAMLGFLDMFPMSGYDLKKLFDSSVKYYWTATHSQIYRTLNEMNKEGLIDIEIVQQTDVPNKKIYHITEKGKKDLISWVETSTELPPVRHKLLVQLSWADRLTNEKIIKLLENYCEKLKERIGLYESQHHKQTIELGRTEREKFLWKSLLDNGRETYITELKWALNTIKGLQDFQNPEL